MFKVIESVLNQTKRNIILKDGEFEVEVQVDRLIQHENWRKPLLVIANSNGDVISSRLGLPEEIHKYMMQQVYEMDDVYLNMRTITDFLESKLAQYKDDMGE